MVIEEKLAPETFTLATLAPPDRPVQTAQPCALPY
jgi:hypothetical protein